MCSFSATKTLRWGFFQRQAPQKAEDSRPPVPPQHLAVTRHTVVASAIGARRSQPCGAAAGPVSNTSRDKKRITGEAMQTVQLMPSVIADVWRARLSRFGEPQQTARNRCRQLCFNNHTAPFTRRHQEFFPLCHRIKGYKTDNAASHPAQAREQPS